MWLAAPVLQAPRPLRSRSARRILRRRLFGPRPPDDVVDDVLERWERTPTAVMAAYLPGLAAYDQRAAMEALRDVPVLVLAGTDDSTVAPAVAQQLAGVHAAGSPSATGAGTWRRGANVRRTS